MFAEVTDIDELKEAVAIGREMNKPIFMIGNGSNLLISDKGYDGMMLRMRGGFSGFGIKHNVIVAEAGVQLGSLVTTARKKSLEGMAFAAGIPGTVGGALMMNAGGAAGTISDIVEMIKILTPKGEVEVITNPDARFGYRKSDLKEMGIILAATIRLEPGDPAQVTAQIVEALDKKRRTQPIEARTAGSVYKNPKGRKAAELIEQAGCKGMTVGDAKVSRMHANFILNIGQAKALDVTQLMEKIEKAVQDESGVTLEREIELVGEF
jgi:UDP-N-acetylmuramate dehydrogenase